MIKSDTTLTLEDRAFELATKLATSNLVELSNEFDIFDLTNTLIKTQRERDEKIEFTDKLINYNDEILSIEDVGELETIDIAVTGDNLFYCNGILTKNSMGIPAIADWFAAIINTDDLKQLKQLLFKQLKNRYNGIADYEKFILGVDYLKMKLYELDNPSAIPIKPIKAKIETANDTLNYDVLHTIKPATGSFSDFNF